MSPKRILIVEDEELVAQQVNQVLTASGYDVVGVTDSGEQAIADAALNRPDLVIMDIVLSGPLDGISAAEQMQSLGIPVIYLSGYSDRHLVDRAQHTQPLAYVSKPATSGALTAAVQIALFRREREQEQKLDRNQRVTATIKAEEQFRLMVEAVVEHSIFTLDTSGNISSWNAGAERMNGYSTNEILGRFYALLFTTEDREKQIPEWELEEARLNGSADDTRWLVRRNGERYWAEGALTAIRDEAGILLGFAKITHDATEQKRIHEALRNSKERLRIALRAARTGTWHWDIPTNTDVLDDNLSELFGLPPEQTIIPIQDFYARLHREDRPRVEAAFKRTEEEGVHLDIEFRIVRPDGTERWLLDQGEVVCDEAGKPEYMAGACVDITERKLMEIALRQSEEQFRLFVNNVRDYALFQLDCEGKIVTWNSGAERLLGFTAEEIVGKPAALIFVPEDVATGQHERELLEATSSGRAVDERWHQRMDGTRFWASGVLTSVLDSEGRLRGFAKIMRDETERRVASEKLEASLKEKEVLLKEIHHRVKNNLQVITSLLSLQSDTLEDEAVQVMFEEACNRVRSIGDIHELLYRSPDLAHISFATYLERLSSYLLAFYKVEPNRIQVSVSADVDLPISLAIPCGLIVNELLTNSLKHAFVTGTDGSKSRSGSIRISLYCQTDRCVLEVADDGVGFPEGFEIDGANSLGLKLVTVLAKQLRGRVQMEGTGGACVSVTFPREEEPSMEQS